MSVKEAARTNIEAVARLRQNFSESSLGGAFIEELMERHIGVTFAPGAIVFSEGSTSDVLGCVLSGFVKVYCPLEDGNRTLMRISGPGEVIGYADSVDDRGRKARLFEVQSLTKAMVALITRDHIARMLRSMDTHALVGFLESLNTFWSIRTRWFATLLGLPFQRRLELVFEDLATRVGVSDTEGTVLIPELCHEELAEMIGCSRPMVSRLIRDMTEAGALARRGKQYVLVGGQNQNQLSSVSTGSVKKLSALGSQSPPRLASVAAK